MKTLVPGLDLVPGDENLAGVETALANDPKRSFRLRDALRGYQARAGDEGYDIILIDCPPSLSSLTVNAMTASDSLLVPLQCEFFAMEGLSQLLRTVQIVKNGLNPDLDIQGIVLTMFDKRNRLSAEVESEAREKLGGKVYIYQTVIPRNVRLSEAPGYGKPALLYDHKCIGSEAYIRLASELLHRERDLVMALKFMTDEPKPKGSKLGKGLSALMGEYDSFDNTIGSPGEANREVAMLRLKRIRPNPNQPRKMFDEDRMHELQKSVEAKGVLTPILVREVEADDHDYQIIAGERRFRAAKMAGLDEIPARILKTNEVELLEIGLIENIQRENLNAIEEAEGYQALIGRFGKTQEALLKLSVKAGRTSRICFACLICRNLCGIISAKVKSRLAMPGQPSRLTTPNVSFLTLSVGNYPFVKQRLW